MTGPTEWALYWWSLGYRNQRLPTHNSWLWTSLPNSEFSDDTVRAWTWPRWEFTPQKLPNATNRSSVFPESWLLNTYWLTYHSIRGLELQPPDTRSGICHPSFLAICLHPSEFVNSIVLSALSPCNSCWKALLGLTSLSICLFFICHDFQISRHPGRTAQDQMASMWSVSL